MDPLSKFLNLLIERVHPWHRVRLIMLTTIRGFPCVKIQVGSVAATVHWHPIKRVWELFADEFGDAAFIQRIRDIMAGKVRDDAGNMIDKP